MRWAVREFEEHDCPAGEAARTRRAVKAAEREVACEACGWVAVTEKHRGPALLAEHRKVCPNPGTSRSQSGRRHGTEPFSDVGRRASEHEWSSR